ncbi:MAG TPA: spermidine synthase [Arcobacter sp.]|jgi:spermidine synthase|nr:spermidine synthase [Arcobacter sp.]
MLSQEIIKAEMMVHIPLNTHKEPKSVLVVAGDDNFKKEIEKYDCDVTFSDELNVEGTYDVVIYNSNNVDDMVLANVNRVLEPTCGVFVSSVISYELNSDAMSKQLDQIGSQFWIAMPYRFEGMTAILASKKYHPQADIILDRSDFVDTEYYYTELQNACFVMPAYAQKALTGIARR